MLSWASYLFGGASSEPQQDDANTNPDDVAMETDQVPSEKDWVVVEHNGDSDSPKVDITDLENLLIEHPSMSVYKRSGSAGDESNESDSSNKNVSNKRSHVATRLGAKQLRSMSARTQLLAQVSQVKHAQAVQKKKQTKRDNKKCLGRLNAVSDKSTPRKNRVRNPSGRMNGRVPQRKQ